MRIWFDLHLLAGIRGDYPFHRIGVGWSHLHERHLVLLRKLLFAMQSAWRFFVYG